MSTSTKTYHNNFTPAGRQKALATTHRLRTIRCCWPDGCDQLVEARSNVAYCTHHRAEGKRLNYQRQHARRRIAKNPAALPQSGRPPKTWLVVHDPDGDFTNRELSCSEVAAMLRLYSFSPGTILKRGEEIVTVE